LQLGGSDPRKLAEAAGIGEAFGYDEINLNCGCPSDRVRSGTFGACLMQTPEVVAACVAAMKRSVSVPVTVKCRIGVDDQDPETALDALADSIFAAGADALWVHARKAWLEGLSPRENRDIPPLNYDRVYRLKQRLSEKFIGMNGGIQSIEEASNHLLHTDGVMLGRVAYHTPAILAEADGLAGPAPAPVDFAALLARMSSYADEHIERGGRLSHVTRHMVGLFHGRPGARRFRQILSTEGTRPGAGSAVLRRAFAAVEAEQAREAA
jgi:tRNA-dihydrouridine synthase A